MIELRQLGQTGLRVSRLGLGLAAVGRPGYITLGRARDLPRERTPEALAARSAELCNAAWTGGIRYFDAARSYGRAEEFLARWLGARGLPAGAVTIGSKWGYRYTAGWTVDAAVHEEKELSLARFEQQLGETCALLGAQLDLYQIHSATAESGCLDDARLLAALVGARRSGACRALGLSLSGPTSDRALERALAARVDGERVFDVVQATVNVLEPSLLPLLAAARAEGLGVIAKEVHANGRLTELNDRPQDAELVTALRRIAAEARTTVADLALAWVLAQPQVDVALSGAATTAQLASHVRAAALGLEADAVGALASFGEAAPAYWATRGRLPWT
ncbi:MAG: aldo/keto reductase [Deltaproteobacteria bacterium]|nr:aldo/keto reductase [Deltaproteobacteria bacterium]